MKVYIVTKGMYEESYIAGVYSSLEKAMAAHQQKGGWMPTSDTSWSNGLDWGAAAYIGVSEVDDDQES